MYQHRELGTVGQRMLKHKGRRHRSNRRSRQDRRSAKVDPTDIRKVIYTLDAYRAHLFYDITWIDQKVEQGSLGRDFAASWKVLRRKMIKMARVSNSIPGVHRLARLQSSFEALWQISVPMVFILLFANLLAPGIPVVRDLAPYFMVFALATLIIGLLARFLIGGRIGRRIKGYFAKNPEAHKLRAYELRDAVQLLIEELRRFIRDTGSDPGKHLVGVGFLDYKHIKVAKKPRPWRKYYLVKVTL